jgi:hypothetical protein
LIDQVVGVTFIAVPRKQKNRFVNLPERQEFNMSRVNGDKSRFNRVRKQNAAKRARNRKLLKNAELQAKPVTAAAASESKPVVA